MTIGQRIAELRKQNNLSQEALGEALGVSRQAISKWESDAALPEIDKLIALSKRFGVTVGWLLGVEEGAHSAPEEDQAAAADTERGPTEAEVLERYLASLPQKKPISPGRKKRLTLAGVLVAVCLVVMFVRISSLQDQLGQVNSQVANLSNQLVGVQSQLSGLSDAVSQQVQSALEQEYGITASWELTLEGADYPNGVADLSFCSVLREPVENVEDVTVYAVDVRGNCVIPEEENWDAGLGTYTARLRVPLEDGVSYYLVAHDIRVCLADEDHELCWLGEGMALQCYGYAAGQSDSGGINADVSVDVFPPWMLPLQELLAQGAPEVRAWLVRDGERLREVDVIPAAENAPDIREGWHGYANLKIRTGDVSPEEGTRIWVEYEVEFPGGLSASGVCDETWVWSGQAWNWAPSEAET